MEEWSLQVYYPSRRTAYNRDGVLYWFYVYQQVACRGFLNKRARLVRQLLHGRFSEEQINKIVEEFVSEKYTHDYPITGKKCTTPSRRRVKFNIPGEVYEFMRLYGMESRPSRPGVEYVPIMPRK